MRNYSVGFTLVETLVALGIGAIVLAFAIPSLSQLLARNQTTQSVNSMLHALANARIQAVQKQKLVSLCPSQDTIHCEKDWNLQIISFVDTNNDRERQPEDEPLIQIIPPEKSASWTMRPVWKSYFQFDAMGMAHGALGSLMYCHQNRNNETARRIFINMGGRARLSNDTNNDGIHEDSDGKPMNCLGV